MVLSLFKNKTFLIQGSGCWDWKEHEFGSICDGLRELEMNVAAGDSTTPSSRSPTLYLSQIIHNIRRSGSRAYRSMVRNSSYTETTDTSRSYHSTPR